MTENAGSWHRFRGRIEEALDLLREHEIPAAEEGQGGTEVVALPSLLEQCRAMTGAGDGTEDGTEDGTPAPPVLRIVHHFACTGGTLISRCIAAMPNVRLLSEVDPLSAMAPEPAFMPTDLIGLVRTGSRPADAAMLAGIFTAGLAALEEADRAAGLRLVLRDHAHGLFCTGPAIPDRPALSEILAPGRRLLELVTVRHPLDSFLSLLNQGWVHFEPATLEEYARRHAAFLDRYANAELLRYEDFVADPDTAMRRICRVLDLPFNPDFRDLAPAIRLSGNSGRRGDEIAPRPRRPVPDEVARQARESAAYAALCTRLDYDPAPDAAATAP